MTRRSAHPIRWTAKASLVGLLLCACLAAPARADKKSQAKDQFERAVAMHTQLEGYLPRDRSLSDYKQTIAAYRKVYLISAQAEEVTPALIAESGLYQEMGKQYDPKYFQSAIDVCNFLIKQYPGSRYRGEAELTIARIQRDDLNQLDAAVSTYKDYLKKFPHSENAGEARQALNEIADARLKKEEQREAPPATAQVQAASAPAAGTSDGSMRPESVPPRKPGELPRVTDIHTWNAQDHTRIVVTLNDAVKYDAMRLRSPERIYFDLYKAQLDRSLAKKEIAVDNGLLKSVRVAQNKEGVVRLVLDVNGAKNYSAFTLTNPNRLVIDVQTQPLTAGKSSPANSAGAPQMISPQPSETVAARVPVPDSPPAKPIFKAPSAKAKADARAATVAALHSPTPAKPTRDGEMPLTRALGLKISRIVIDPGHGGKDTGTIGPHGLMEKDLCLDVALRLGKEIEEKLPGAQVIYTRKDDTFIPLEERTAIANQAKADLFISIHANSSHDHAARGVETYYLNFATSAESMEVAARENALSQESLHDLQTLIQKIARNEKIEESKELATDIQDSLTHRMQLVSQSERNRGVKKAPFVVLIGANMPSVLSEISFISNPSDEKLLRRGDQRQRVADGLYRGIAEYLDSLNSLSFDKSRLVSDRVGAPATTATVVAPDGNSK